jgi:hypothetical protein
MSRDERLLIIFIVIWSFITYTIGFLGGYNQATSKYQQQSFLNHFAEY